MGAKNQFIFLAILLKASMSTVPGQIKVIKNMDWESWLISYEQILDTLRAMQTHNIIELTEQENTFLVALQNWQDYDITDSPVFP